MIEDSLKNIRNIYRLILTVSFITIVFSLSINPPQAKKDQLKILNELNEFPFVEYDSFVRSKVEEFSLKTLVKLSKELEKNINDEDLLIYNLHHIHEAFATNAHTGKLLIEELLISNVSSATLHEFNTLKVLPLDKNIQVIVPEIIEISKEISSFLKENYELGLRVDNVNLSIVDFDKESFLPNDTTIISLYFELPAKIRTGGAPVFNSDFPAKIISLPDTSFQKWIVSNARSKNIVNINAGNLEWVPSLVDLPNGFMEEKVGLLIKQLDEEIKKSSPEEQNISLLGANISGVLFVYASPILLIGLIYFLLNNSSHLLLLSRTEENIIYFKQFSWSPLSLNNNWHYDLLISIIFLPSLSLMVLYFQLTQFGSISYYFISLLIIAVLSYITLSALFLKNILVIRYLIGK